MTHCRPHDQPVLKHAPIGRLYGPSLDNSNDAGASEIQSRDNHKAYVSTKQSKRQIKVSTLTLWNWLRDSAGAIPPRWRRKRFPRNLCPFRRLCASHPVPVFELPVNAVFVHDGVGAANTKRQRQDKCNSTAVGWPLTSASESLSFCVFSFTFISKTCSISCSIFFILVSCSRRSSSIWANGFLRTAQQQKQPAHQFPSGRWHPRPKKQLARRSRKPTECKPTEQWPVLHDECWNQTLHLPHQHKWAHYPRRACTEERRQFYLTFKV